MSQALGASGIQAVKLPTPVSQRGLDSDAGNGRLASPWSYLLHISTCTFNLCLHRGCLPPPSLFLSFCPFMLKHHLHETLLPGQLSQSSVLLAEICVSSVLPKLSHMYVSSHGPWFVSLRSQKHLIHLDISRDTSQSPVTSADT